MPAGIRSSHRPARASWGSGLAALAAAVLLFSAVGIAQNQKTRSVQGSVTASDDSLVTGAVVYLKNTKTLAVKTYIAQTDGTYRFPELSPNVDYDVYAQKDGQQSKSKTLSQFDDRDKPNINLQIDTNK